MTSYSIIKKLSITCLIGALIIWVLYPFIYPILFAALLAIILAPVQVNLEKHIGRHKSSFLIAMGILLCIFIPMLIAISYAITEIISYLQNSESLSQTFNQLSNSIAKIPYAGDYLQQYFDKLIGAIKHDKEKIIANLGQILPAIRYIGSTSISLLTDFLITILLVYQFLVSGSTVEKFFKNIVLKDFHDSDSFISTAIITTRRVSLAIFLTAMLVGIIMGITFSALSIPSPILFAFVSAIASMIPFMVGIVYILLGAAVFVIYGVTKAIIILVIGFALNIFTDNIMQPKIINKQVKLSFVASLIGIMGGIQAFGFIGIFLGPVIFNVAFVGIEKLMDGKEY
ncbi:MULTISPECIES: AI-2E family transporter [unclassified Francisella]|uniref:AI-2E family transporter n=1 Tax=unclassified Francisella TaxID=2610885 RepID=UPI002E343C24|nr:MULTISPECIES: AI-2E family transporter [unclassified Francisella]MED7819462.1 AI-2E family transporter [Francisella sp. 19S2-4]MED7830251.1 AI-2E family transporter [Francisella sp. 19S2-10]